MRTAQLALVVASLGVPLARSEDAMSEEVKTQLVFSLDRAEDLDEWEVVNDTVMGGVSTAQMGITDGGTAVFSGTVSLDNSGGFASVRSRPKDRKLGGQQGIVLRVKGDGKRYKLTVRQDSRWDGVMYQAPFKATEGKWQEVRVPFGDFVPTYRGRELLDRPEVTPDRIRSLGFLISDKQSGPFRLEIDWIKAYVED
jgi:monofunctional biosynthetic peptidoglycan transglycosylase